MNMKSLDVVSLAKQALAIIEELRLLTGGGRFLSPSLRTLALPRPGRNQARTRRI
jgi:hypothetical protein